MSHPEGEGFLTENDPDRKRRINIKLTEREINVVLTALHNDLVETSKQVQSMTANQTEDADYDILCQHATNLEHLIELLRRSTHS